jgi:opacity protein-like surface antigen
VGKTLGTVSKIEKNWEETELSKKSETYEGQGGGVRFYFTPKWSMHGEYMRLRLEDKETNFKHSQDRFQVGLSYEF